MVRASDTMVIVAILVFLILAESLIDGIDRN